VITLKFFYFDSMSEKSKELNIQLKAIQDETGLSLSKLLRTPNNPFKLTYHLKLYIRSLLADQARKRKKPKKDKKNFRQQLRDLQQKSKFSFWGFLNDAKTLNKLSPELRSYAERLSEKIHPKKQLRECTIRLIKSAKAT